MLFFSGLSFSKSNFHFRTLHSWFSVSNAVPYQVRAGLQKAASHPLLTPKLIWAHGKKTVDNDEIEKLVKVAAFFALFRLLIEPEDFVDDLHVR